MKIPNGKKPYRHFLLSLARIVSEDSQLAYGHVVVVSKSSKDS